MPCCFGALIVVALPRVALVLMWLTGYGGQAFDTVLWPVLGFFFLPFTTCAYALALNEFGGIEGAGLALLIIGVLFDFGGYGSSDYARRYRTVRIERY